MASRGYNSVRGSSVAFDSSSSSQVSWHYDDILIMMTMLSPPGVTRSDDVSIPQHPAMVISHRVQLVWYKQVTADQSEDPIITIDQSEVRGVSRCWGGWPPTCRPTPTRSSRALRGLESAHSHPRLPCSTRSRCHHHHGKTLRTKCLFQSVPLSQ